MSERPKQPRGPGGKFVKAEPPALFIDEDVISARQRFADRLIPPPFSREDFNRAVAFSEWISLAKTMIVLILGGIVIVAAIAWLW